MLTTFKKSRQTKLSGLLYVVIIYDSALSTVQAAIFTSNPLIYIYKPKCYDKLINFTEPQLALQIVLFCAFSGATYLGVKSPPRIRIGHSPS